MRKFNFSSGPGIMPLSVLQQSAEGILNFDQHGISIAELPHRHPWFRDILDELIALFRELLHLSDEHEVIILQGGARIQFAQIPMNFLQKHETAGFVDTGYWAHKAMEYCRLYGDTRVLSSSENLGYRCIPQLPSGPDDIKYVHIAANNTIYGTQYRQLPTLNTPLIVDMSSEILGIRRDFSHIDLAFACAQKNIGPAGVSVVIVKKDFLALATDRVPPVFSYKNLLDQKSNYATPPVVNVYMSLLNLRWLKAHGGVDNLQQLNEQKAALLYNEIDHNALFSCPVMPADRSLMNICFSASDEAMEKSFLQFCSDNEIIGLGGHSSAGALRASLYNAQPIENVQYLVQVMREFSNRYS